MKMEIKVLSDWLEEHRDKTLLITKTEQGDVDRVRMKLSKTGFHAEHDNPHDDYTDGDVLYLRGEGSVLTDDRESPLPQDTFTIPIKGLRAADIDDANLRLTTERAEYDILSL